MTAIQRVQTPILTAAGCLLAINTGLSAQQAVTPQAPAQQAPRHEPDVAERNASCHVSKPGHGAAGIQHRARPRRHPGDVSVRRRAGGRAKGTDRHARLPAVQVVSIARRGVAALLRQPAGAPRVDATGALAIRIDHPDAAGSGGPGGRAQAVDVAGRQRARVRQVRALWRRRHAPCGELQQSGSRARARDRDAAAGTGPEDARRRSQESRGRHGARDPTS